MNGVSPEAKVQVKTRANSKTASNTNTQVEVSRGALLAVGIPSVLVGIWAAACFFSGIFSIGGPFTLIKSWFSTITGM